MVAPPSSGAIRPRRLSEFGCLTVSVGAAGVDGSETTGGSPIRRVRVALLSDRVTTCIPKAMTSAELEGSQKYGSDIAASAIITSSVSPSLRVIVIRPFVSKAGVKRSLGPVREIPMSPA